MAKNLSRAISSGLISAPEPYIEITPATCPKRRVPLSIASLIKHFFTRALGEGGLLGQPEPYFIVSSLPLFEDEPKFGAALNENGD